jgi:hypothetical protein
MPCVSLFGAPLAATALGWGLRLLPANGRIVGFRGRDLVKVAQVLFRLQVVRTLLV